MGLLDLQSLPPLMVHSLTIFRRLNGQIGDQSQVTIEIRTVIDEWLRATFGIWQPDLEPAQLHVHYAPLTRVLEGDAKDQREVHGGYKIIQELVFPPIETVVADLNPPAVLGPHHKLSLDQVCPMEDPPVV